MGPPWPGRTIQPLSIGKQQRFLSSAQARAKGPGEVLPERLPGAATTPSTDAYSTRSDAINSYLIYPSVFCESSDEAPTAPQHMSICTPFFGLEALRLEDIQLVRITTTRVHA